MTAQVRPAGTGNLLARLSLRRELQYVLLAAMESCWVYIVLAFFAALLDWPHTVSILSIFIAYWIALSAGRALPRLRHNWTLLQVAAIMIACVTLLAVVRVELYPGAGLLDWNWLVHYAQVLVGFNQRLSADLMTTLAVIFVFVRGLRFGQRPLTLWFVGFQFRLGIVVLFILLLAAGFLKPFDPSLWVMFYFFLSLLAIALARMEEAGSQVTLSVRWIVTLVASAGAVLFLAVAFLQVLTLELADRVLGLLIIPLTIIGGLLFVLLAIPASWLLGWLFDLLSPLFDRFQGLSQMLQGMLSNVERLSGSVESQGSFLETLAPLLKALFIVGIVVGVGVLLARMLNRRMKELEHEAYLRETIGPEEADARVREERRRKKRSPLRRRNASAETIRRIYAALVSRASDAGLPRRAAETPYEFLPRLESAFPGQAEGLHTITEAYVAVHYAEHVADPVQVDGVRLAWEQVQKQMPRKT